MKFDGLEPQRCEDITNCGTQNRPGKLGTFEKQASGIPALQFSTFAFLFLAACFPACLLFSGFSSLYLVPLCSFANCFLLLLQFCFTLL